jgi:hypothetical protein
MKKIIPVMAVLVLTAGYCFGDDISDALGKNAAAGPLGGMLGNLSMAGLMWGILFSGVGVGAFLYGKKKSNAAFIVIGVLLSVYPYVVQQTILIVVIGAALCAALYFFRRG